jgi:hypothetical protein
MFSDQINHDIECPIFEKANSFGKLWNRGRFLENHKMRNKMIDLEELLPSH